MARPREQLQELFEEITTNVYFQPPPNAQMTYPCIVYSRDADDTKFADNILYAHKKRYQVTLISRDPDDYMWDQIRQFPLCSFDRFYTADNLNHDVFTIFF